MKNTKILIATLVLFLSCSSLQSVGSDSSTKNGSVSSFVKNGLWGAGAGFASAGLLRLASATKKWGNHSPTLKQYLGAGFGVGISVMGLKYLYDYCTAPYTPEQLLKLIINNPKKALAYTSRLNDKFFANAEKSPKKILELARQYEHDCPILLLGECMKEDWGHCILSRDYNPKFRDHFESKVVAAMSKRLEGGKTVNYVGFGSGGMFQDLVIMAKMLTKNPTAQININLIDPKYWVYVAMRDYLKNGREVGQKYDDTPTEEFADYALKKVKEAVGTIEVSDGEFKENTKTNATFEGMKYKQFISFLQKAFPNASLTLSIHESADKYLEYVDANNLPYPDVITAADIQDEMSFGSLKDYFKLSLLAKKKQPSSINLWLSKGEENLNPELVTYSFKKLQGGEKIDIKGKLDYAKNINHIWQKAVKI
ncbi:TPA: hypothetical protein DDZ86_01395 [Candidatus Dependentiae bacterium]|nr:MAG: hypothetical protein UW09_C0004G0157 [candidate division TM6 bacterium GW2011_GWF2_43_87]HBL98278.1 hypothetical protein [Candidatus Dependentiae bacterium]